MLTWTDLLARLRKDSAANGLGEQVEDILSHHKVEDCMGLRHSLVHGAVDVTQPPTIAINRRQRGTPEGPSNSGTAA